MKIVNFFKGLWFSLIGHPYLAMKYWKDIKCLNK